MHSAGYRRASPWLLAALGVSLFTFAAVWHLGIEAMGIDGLSGPVVAFLLDGLPPLALVYASYRLVELEFDRERIWTVFVWSLVGAAVFSAVIGLSVLIREAEGRVVAEPVFVVLLAADTGAIAGVIAGYYAAKARDDADRAARAINTLQFVNGLLRHDIRNSLTVIMARADVLEADADSDRASDAAAAIREQVDKIVDLSENAGAVADTLSSDASLEPVDLAEITADVVDRVGNTHDVSVSLDSPDSAPVLATDAVRPIVRNLVGNAVEHGSTERADESGDGSADITVTIEETDDTVRLIVADRGPGIPDDEKDDIFAPRAGDTHGGGLHLVETLVQAFGGDIRVEDNEPRGAVFVVELRRQ